MGAEDEMRGYKRGYRHALQRRWVQADAATIPPQHAGALIRAASALSDKIDAFLANLDDRETEPTLLAIDEARWELTKQIDATRFALLEEKADA